LAHSDHAAPYAAPAARPARMTVPAMVAMPRDGKRIAMLTCYDASFAAQCDAAGVDILLVGDSPWTTRSITRAPSSPAARMRS